MQLPPPLLADMIAPFLGRSFPGGDICSQNRRGIALGSSIETTLYCIDTRQEQLSDRSVGDSSVPRKTKNYLSICLESWRKIDTIQRMLHLSRHKCNFIGRPVAGTAVHAKTGSQTMTHRLPLSYSNKHTLRAGRCCCPATTPFTSLPPTKHASTTVRINA